MRIGRLRHRIELQANAPTPAADGSEIDNYQPVAVVWGEFLENRGREFMSAQEAHSELIGKITIRYRSDVKSEWRAKYDGRTFDITHVADLKGRRRFQELFISEIR